jgi:mevalonate kinase
VDNNYSKDSFLYLGVKTMEITASAPGKVILFGEHAVVLGKPAIAVAVDRRVSVTIRKGKEAGNVNVEIPSLDVHGSIYPYKGTIKNYGHGEAGILHYIKGALQKTGIEGDLELEVSLDIPVGAGLGSSAAITVATLAAAARYNKQDLTKEQIAETSRQVELEVQGAASPMDTAISTYGGVIYLSKEELTTLKPARDLPLVVGYTSQPGNTGELVAGVGRRRNIYPDIINPIMDSIENLTNEAREAIIQGEEKRIGELMNINQGLLDALGVNTWELSRLVYQARQAGALGSKLTGAGGGGSMIAYCPGRTREVLRELKNLENAFQVGISSKGLTLEMGGK